jgi:hypothetical protein
MQVEDLTLTARCPSCGSSIHVTVSSMLQPAVVAQPDVPKGPTPEQQDAETKANVEQAVRDLFR